MKSILARQPDFPPEVLGYGMAAFFGGRAECRIRKVPLPVVYVDFLSMYPTVNALMGSWTLSTARRIRLRDVTTEVIRLLTDPDLFARCFDPTFWRQLLVLVEVEPDREIFPVRARYDSASADFGIGVNPYRLAGRAWYALGDVVAAVLVSGRVPRVVRALALRPVGRQGTRSVFLRGQMAINPAEGDFYVKIIEDRHRTRADRSLPEGERDRLAGFEKTLANSTSYGILAQFDRMEADAPARAQVWSANASFVSEPVVPEDPGPFCFPPLAACITGGARLMLALLERCVTDAEGSYLFCDTDSMGIVASRAGGLIACPGGPHCTDVGDEAVRALSWAEVDAIVARFAALNPYDRSVVPGSILKVEAENFDG